VIVDAQSPDRIAFRSSAKLNLFLEVLDRRADGFHEIETLFQEISLCDRLEIERAEGPPAIEIAEDGPPLAAAGENLVERAAAAFLSETGLRARLRIVLHKNVPAGSGLGGGSANAAAVLLALQRLLGSRLPWERAQALASRLGSDCAFFLRGGAAVGRGRGEALSQMQLPRFAFLVAVPDVHCSTAEVYAALARARASASLKGPRPTRTIATLQSMSGIDRVALDRLAFNRFEEIAFERYPQLSKVAAALKQTCQTPVHMTGSGSGLFVIHDDPERANAGMLACREAAAAGAIPHLTPGRIFVAESLPEREY
jgi:4-diphosphocytidyl-2-C-methyl-D-erythritol kinase